MSEYRYNMNSAFKKGHTPWSKGKKGLFKHTEETLKKMKSHVRTEEHKKHLSEAQKGFKPSEETKKKLREARLKQKIIRKDTKPELKVESELKRRNIYFEKQVPLCKISIVDFYIPEFHIVIQVDGCYWHGCPIHFPNASIDRKYRDKNQDNVLTYNGFNVYRFWEHEIDSSVENCINSIFNN